MKNLPILYGLDKQGNTRSYQITVVENKIITKHGFVGGKIMEAEREYEGKNIGKKNETTPCQQAELVAWREWLKQTEKGYAPGEDDVEGLRKYREMMKQKAAQGNTNLGVSESIRGVKSAVRKNKDMENFTIPGFVSKIKPMLCAKWDEKESCYKYFSKGFYVQVKFDGVRVLATMTDSGVALTSRTGKQFPWFADLKHEIAEFMNAFHERFGFFPVLDGELYAHQFHAELVKKGKSNQFVPSRKSLPKSAHFQCISSMAKVARSEPHPLENQMKYFIFDLAFDSDSGKKTPKAKTPKSKAPSPGNSKTQDERIQMLDEMIPFESDRVKIVFTAFHDEEAISIVGFPEIVDFEVKDAMKRGYEGIILRSPDGEYLSNGKRSLYVRKHKLFDDAEFPIEGAEHDPGVDRSNFSWICSIEVNGEKKRFNVKPEGTEEQRREWWDDRKSYYGKNLTVKYQGTSSDGIPRFPIGVGVRDYE